MSPHDKLIIVIGIIQDSILADDSKTVGEEMFPGRRFRTSSLEIAEDLLASILPDVEALS